MLHQTPLVLTAQVPDSEKPARKILTVKILKTPPPKQILLYKVKLKNKNILVIV